MATVATQAVINKPPLRIAASRSCFDIGLRELWAYRELLGFFVWRDVKIRYKQTVIGVAWALLQPFLTMLLFSLIFGRLAKLPTNGPRRNTVLQLADPAGRQRSLHQPPENRAQSDIDV